VNQGSWQKNSLKMGSSEPYDRPGLETAFAQELRTMKLSKQIGLYTVSFLLGIFYPVTGFASTPQAGITHLVMKNTADSLLVDMKIDSEFTPEMRTAVLNSVPVRITISLSLKKYPLFNLYREVKSDRYTVNFIYEKLAHITK